MTCKRCNGARFICAIEVNDLVKWALVAVPCPECRPECFHQAPISLDGKTLAGGFDA